MTDIHITQVTGWGDIGYFEDSLSVPFETSLKIKEKWRVSDVHPSPGSLFSLLKLPICNGTILDDYLNTHYIQCNYTCFNYPIFGWVDNVTIVSSGVVGIIWHVDYWRTYFKQCEYIGWVKRRAPSEKNPYHVYPSISSHGCLEDITLAKQRRGICWVILTFIEGNSSFSATLNAGVNSLPGCEYAKTVLSSAVNGVKGIFTTIYNHMMTGEQPTYTKRVIGVDFPSAPDTDKIRCITFPICVDLNIRVQFRAEQQAGAVFSGPSALEVCNGMAGNAFSIYPGNLISCYVSPVCPLVDKGGVFDTGLFEDRPIILGRQDGEYLIKDFTQGDVIVSSTCQNDQGYLKIKNYGIRCVGSIKNGCEGIPEVLNTYYTGHYDISDLVYVENNKTYTVKIEKSSLKGTTWDGKETYMLVPLKQYLNIFYPSWVHYNLLNVRCLVNTNITGNHSRIFYNEKQPKWTLEGNTWKLKVDSDFKDIYTNIEDKSFIVKYASIVTDVVRFRNISEIEHEWVEDRYDINRLYIGVCKGDKWTDFNLSGLKIDPLDDYLTCDVQKFRSLLEWSGRECIGSRSLTWPIISGELDKEYKADEYHDLLLIGPNGNVIHHFKTGVAIKKYTYQTVIAGIGGYIKLRFECNNPYVMASDCEVNIPLTPMTAFTTYSNPMARLNEDAQRLVKSQLENERIARSREIEDENIKLNRSKEDDGIVSSMQRGVGGIVNRIKDTAVNVGGPVVDTLSNFVNNAPVISDISKGLGGFFGMFNGTNPRTNEKYESLQETADQLAKSSVISSPQQWRSVEDRIRSKSRLNDDIMRDKVRSIGGFNFESSSSNQLSIGDTSWIHEYGSIKLIYVTKDEYSVNRYYETVQKLGIDVNEYVGTYQKIKPGPLQVDPVRVKGNVPIAAIDYIKLRLQSGVYVDDDI